MIKANELRIGNWFIGYEGRPMQWTIEDFGMISDGFCEIDEIIKSFTPITEKILIKARFEKDDECYSKQVGNSVSLTFNITDLEPGLGLEWKGNGAQFWGECKYVHQLQNLYNCLTGEELTFNLK